ncbi:MAG: hypothetical protein FWF24_05820 [Alphaproteobacteria bacterium]|nr:hypothetical protein [Alphaproteobacteria bacterium]
MADDRNLKLRAFNQEKHAHILGKAVRPKKRVLSRLSEQGQKEVQLLLKGINFGLG